MPSEQYFVCLVLHIAVGKTENQRIVFQMVAQIIQNSHFVGFAQKVRQEVFIKVIIAFLQIYFPEFPFVMKEQCTENHVVEILNILYDVQHFGKSGRLYPIPQSKGTQGVMCQITFQQFIVFLVNQQAFFLPLQPMGL